MYNIEEIKKLFNAKGYKLLTQEYKNNTQELEYICNKHKNKGIQSTCFSSFKRGKGCVYCKYEQGIFVNPLPEDIIKEVTEKHGYIFKGLTRNQKTWVNFVCPKHEEYGIQTKLWVDIRVGKQVCSRCNGHKTLEDFQKLVHEKSPNVDIIDGYEYSSKKVHCKCNICGHEWYPYGYNLLSKKFTGCPECGKKIIGEKRAITKDYVLDKFSKIDSNIIPLTIPQRTHENVKCQCKLCNHMWEATFSNLTKKNNPTGCPFCNMSSGERQILLFLESNNINYEIQKTFDGCKNKRLLPFDFYLPDYNICIEYDGQFHYEERFEVERENESLELTKLRDSIKTNYCLDNNIKLIRISYLEYKNIESILNTELSYII